MKIGTKPYARSRRNELAEVTGRWTGHWKHDRTLDLAQLAATAGVALERLLAERLVDLEVLVALRADVLVRGHSEDPRGGSGARTMDHAWYPTAPLG